MTGSGKKVTALRLALLVAAILIAIPLIWYATAGREGAKLGAAGGFAGL